MTSETKNTDNKSNHTPTQLGVVLIVLVAVCAAFIFTQKKWGTRSRVINAFFDFRTN